MRQQLLSPIGPRVPVVKAHPTVMPRDTESDEEHKAAKGLPWKPRGTHEAHIKRQAGKHKHMHKGERARRTISQTCTVRVRTHKQAGKHKSRWMHSFTGTRKHAQRRWRRIKKHRKPRTSTNADLLVLPGTASPLTHRSATTALSEINPEPNRYFHFSVHVLSLFTRVSHRHWHLFYTGKGGIQWG